MNSSLVFMIFMILELLPIRAFVVKNTQLTPLCTHASSSISTTAWGNNHVLDFCHRKQKIKYASNDLRAVGDSGEEGTGEFWSQQKNLAASLTAEADKEELQIKQESAVNYDKRLSGLISDCLFFSVIIFCILWGVALSPATPISYMFGALLGTAYSYGLGKYVQTIGGSVEDAGAVQGAGVGQARFAFLILLFVFASKFRSIGFQEIPSIAGFFTYQLASLSQGLKEFED